MPNRQINQYLREHKVQFDTIDHDVAYTAQEIAARAHIRARDLVKSVVMKMDGKIVIVMLPANRKVNLDDFKRCVECKEVSVAREGEFEAAFPECELGAMPPLGHLYGVEVFASEKLKTDHNIAFNAGTHGELIQLKWKDFEKLESPTVIPI